MDVLLEGYAVNQPTWFYLSTLLIMAVFFRFNRLWSIRNLDLILLLSITPGLLLVESGNSGHDVARSLGYVWLFTVSGFYVVRLLLDQVLVRRPQVGQNLNSGGLTFLCVAAAAFLTAQALKQALPDGTTKTVSKANEIVNRTAVAPEEQGEKKTAEEVEAGPAASLIAAPVGIVFENLAARILSVLAHATVVVGLIMAGRNLFGDSQLGLAMGTLYLLLPCTAYDVGEFNHVLPSALVVWAVVCYRSPIVSGVLLGLACGTMFFPVFLLPLWFAFYGRKGGLRFGAGLAATAVAVIVSLAMTSTDVNALIDKTRGTIDLASIAFSGDQLAQGFWKDADYLSVYRIPVIAAYLVLLTVMTIWPRKKNLEHLLASSALIVVGTQFWFTRQGGIFVLWYLPLLLLVVFRPRLVHLIPPAGHTLASDAAVRPAGATLVGTRTVDRSQVFR
jgi:hypothetical protein